MLKTLAAALVAASVLIAPVAASAETAPATKPVPVNMTGIGPEPTQAEVKVAVASIRNRIPF